MQQISILFVNFFLFQTLSHSKLLLSKEERMCIPTGHSLRILKEQGNLEAHCAFTFLSTLATLRNLINTSQSFVGFIDKKTVSQNWQSICHENHTQRGIGFDLNYEAHKIESILGHFTRMFLTVIEVI